MHAATLSVKNKTLTDAYLSSIAQKAMTNYNNHCHQHTRSRVIATLTSPDSQCHFAADVWECVSAAALAAGRMRSVVKGYRCAAVSFCVC